MSVRAALLRRSLSAMTLVLLAAACGSPAVTSAPPSVAPSSALTVRQIAECRAMAESEAGHWAARWRELGDDAAERAADHARYVGFLRDFVALLERDVADYHAYFGTDWPPKIGRLRGLADSLTQPVTDDGYKALVDQSESELEALLVVGSGKDLTEACGPVSASLRTPARRASAG